jgi:hypothetical protein
MTPARTSGTRRFVSSSGTPSGLAIGADEEFARFRLR